MAEKPAYLADLMSPAAYPEPVSRIDLVETHISYLFLTDRHVYKVKKVVNLGFLDFTTLERRRHFCHREVELNRRMSPSVYLGVAEVRRDGDRHSIDGPGETVDYAVKMRRMPRERELSRLLDRGEIGAAEVRGLAAAIAAAHRKADASLEIARFGGVEAVRRNVAQNLEQVRPCAGRYLTTDAYDDLQAYSLGFLDAKGPLLEERAQQGRVRDCHGDLHTGQIYLVDGEFQFLDCIEFSDLFRYIDVAADIAFLAMDLDFHAQTDLSKIFVQAYVQESGDEGVLSLVDYFKVHRALIRAKVTSIHLNDDDLTPEARRELVTVAQGYYRLAHSYIRWKGPSLILVMGLTGTGKSTVAEALARRWGMAYCSSDFTRKKLAGIAPTDRRRVAFASDIYAPEFTRRTYDAMLQGAACSLGRGESVVLDATFHQAWQRRQAAELAERMGADLWLIECILPEEVARRRLDQREKLTDRISDGRWEVYLRQKGAWEPVLEGNAARRVRLDASGTSQETMDRLLRVLYARASLSVCTP